MNFDDALKAVREATDGIIAVEGEFPLNMSRFVISKDTETKWDSGHGSGRDREFMLYRPVPVYTVEVVVGKTFLYHEAVEIKRQLGDEVECTFDGHEIVESPGSACGLVPMPRYSFSRRAITEFTATVHSRCCGYGEANQLCVDLPSGADHGEWEVIARRKA